LAIIPHTTSWTRQWVKIASELVRRKTSSKNRFLRIVFIADPSSAWDLSGDREAIEDRVSEITLRPWREAAMRRWMEDVGFGPKAIGRCEDIMRKTGGWSLLLHRLGKACHGSPQNWREVLDEIHASWPNHEEWKDSYKFPIQATTVFKELTGFDVPLGTDDLSGFAPGTDVRRVLWWADRLSYVREPKPDNWVLDQLIRSLIGQISSDGDNLRNAAE
jgi:hypothetical protein